MKVIRIGAVWCPTCLVMRPRWQKIEQANPWLETEYYDIDEHPELRNKYNLAEYPTFIFFDSQGKQIEQVSGELEIEQMQSLLNEYKNK